MSRKYYWKMRKYVLKILFRIKTILYRGLDLGSAAGESMPFGRRVMTGSLWGILKAAILTFIVFRIDGLLTEIIGLQSVDKDVFVSVIIGGVGIAGVILGLYCTNIASIYTSCYSSAPDDIAKAFQNDRVNRRCISGISDYIIFGLFVASVSVMKGQAGWAAAAVFTFLTVTVIVSYSIAGNRAYRLSDVYKAADDAYRILYRIISKRLKQRLFVSDNSFQNHFMEAAFKQISLLKSVQKYGAGLHKSRNVDNSVMTEFMEKNLVLISIYWKSKPGIGRTSAWFRNKPRYPQWHLAGVAETSIALRTGTALPAGREPDFWWFEDEIISVNKECLNDLFEKEDYTSVCSYMLSFRWMCPDAIKYKEAEFYAYHADWICKALEKRVRSAGPALEPDGKGVFAGVTDSLSLLYLGLIIESARAYQAYDFGKIVTDVIKGIDSGKDTERIECIRGRQDADFFKKIITEVKAEGKRITPDWIIKQQTAREEYEYLNSLLDIVREGIDNVFGFGKLLLEKKLYYEACLIFIRFYEFESKLKFFISIVEERREELTGFWVDKALKWEEFRLEDISESIEHWKKQIPAILLDCSGHFALSHREKRGEHPDFLGECYNHICEDAVEAIMNGDQGQFDTDFENLSKLMLLYMEDIRSDVAGKKDSYRSEYAYGMLTSPVAEWAGIGGLAVLWGEFHSDDAWKACADKSCEMIFGKNRVTADLAEKLTECMQDRDRFMRGTGGREILRTGWKQSVAGAIRSSIPCETEYEMFERRLKTDSALLRVFCPGFADWGFTADPAEVFWVLCVNPFLSDNRKYHTRYRWEDKLNA